MDLTWPGKAVDAVRLKAWKEMMPQVNEMALDICLGDILQLPWRQTLAIEAPSFERHEWYSIVAARLGPCGVDQYEWECDHFARFHVPNSTILISFSKPARRIF